MDTTAADMLRDIDEELNASDVHLVFAEMKDPVRRKIDRYELTRTIEPSHFFPTVKAAVDAFQKKTGAEWIRPRATRKTDLGGVRTGCAVFGRAARPRLSTG